MIESRKYGLTKEGNKRKGTSEIAEEDNDPVNGQLPQLGLLLQTSHTDQHEVGGTEILTGKDKHDETDREKGRSEEVDQPGVIGPQITRSTLNQLDDHGTEA
jgi:hypothetical protein